MAIKLSGASALVLYSYQSSGAALNTPTGMLAPELQAVWLGPAA